MVPKHLLDTLDVKRMFSWPFWIQPVGDGPYRYVRHVPKIMTELEANPDYYGETPKVPRIVLRYGGNPLVELLSGNVDIVSSVTPLQAMQLAADPRFRIYHTVDRQHTVAITWNHRNPLFRDADVRRALTMSIDRRELNRILNYPDDIPIFDVPVLRRHLLQGIVPDPLPFAPERAARLFARAGWVDTDNDNILEKDGQEFRFTLDTTVQESAEAVFIQDQFRRAGIRMEIRTYDRIALIFKIREHDFDAVIQTYNYIEQFGEFRISGYENPEISRLRDGAWFTFDQNDSDKHMRELWQIFGADIPVTYLHPKLQFLAAHRRVKGMQNNRYLFSIVEHLWIKDNGREPDEEIR
jgi:peptide/nickel transport system substrate-binding protein